MLCLSPRMKTFSWRVLLSRFILAVKCKTFVKSLDMNSTFTKACSCRRLFKLTSWSSMGQTSMQIILVWVLCPAPILMKTKGMCDISFGSPSVLTTRQSTYRTSIVGSCLFHKFRCTFPHFTLCESSPCTMSRLGKDNTARSPLKAYNHHHSPCQSDNARRHECPSLSKTSKHAIWHLWTKREFQTFSFVASDYDISSLIPDGLLQDIIKCRDSWPRNCVPSCVFFNCRPCEPSTGFYRSTSTSCHQMIPFGGWWRPTQCETLTIAVIRSLIAKFRPYVSVDDCLSFMLEYFGRKLSLPD
jgi:hypothetical protein